MKPNSASAKALRFIAIVLMALTAGLVILGGIGTTCVALNPTGYGPKMAPIAQFQWLFIVFVLGGVAFGVWGIRATIGLVKGAKNAYLEALYALIGGAVLGVIHIVASRALRGSSMPVDPIVYINIVTLIVFLIIKIPSIWQGVDFDKGNASSNKPAGGTAAIMLAITTLTIQYTMGPSHTWDNVNYANAFNTSMTVIGLGLFLFGAALFIPWEVLKRSHKNEASIKA